MGYILLLALGLLIVGLSHLPHEMLKDFWNMLRKKDSPYD